MTKYHNKPCEIDGFKLDSQLEYRAYQIIKPIVADSPYVIKRESPVLLLPEIETLEVKLSAVTWRPDFALYHKDDYVPSLFIECKGSETQDFLLKMNMFGRMTYWKKALFVYETRAEAQKSQMAKRKGRVTFLGQLAFDLRQILYVKEEYRGVSN